MPKYSFVIKIYDSREKREADSEPFATYTVYTQAEFDRVYEENKEEKYFAYESTTGVKMTYAGCRLRLNQQEREARHK